METTEIKVTEEHKLTDLEYKNLEFLMAKLNMYLGKRYSIIPNHLHDLAHIGIYDNDGKMIKQTNALDIKEAVELLTK